MKTKIKPFTLKTYIKEVKSTVTSAVRLDQIPENFDFSKVTDLQIASVAEIKAKRSEVNGNIIINSAANLENPMSINNSDCWGYFGKPSQHDFGFTYWKIEQSASEMEQPEQYLNAADNNPAKQNITIYQDIIPEGPQPTQEQFLAKAKDVMLKALSEDGALRLIGNRGDDCNDLVTLVMTEKVHSKGIYFRGIDGQEHKLSTDLPTLAELEASFAPAEPTDNSPIVVELTRNSDIIEFASGYTGPQTASELVTAILNGRNVFIKVNVEGHASSFYFGTVQNFYEDTVAFIYGDAILEKSPTVYVGDDNLSIDIPK